MVQRAIEVRSRLDEPSRVIAALESLGARAAGDRRHRDVFFDVPDGYLELRLIDDGAGGAQLITHRTERRPEPHAAGYEIARVGEPREVEALLRGRFGVRAEVRKRRRDFRWRHTTASVDEVEGAGSFLQLATEVTRIDVREAEAESRMLLAALGIEEGQLVPETYVELLEAAGGSAGGTGEGKRDAGSNRSDR